MSRTGPGHLIRHPTRAVYTMAGTRTGLWLVTSRWVAESDQVTFQIKGLDPIMHQLGLYFLHCLYSKEHQCILGQSATKTTIHSVIMMFLLYQMHDQGVWIEMMFPGACWPIIHVGTWEKKLVLKNGMLSSQGQGQIDGETVSHM